MGKPTKTCQGRKVSRMTYVTSSAGGCAAPVTPCLLLAPRALGKWVEGCGVMWCNDFSESVAKVLWNQWVLCSFKWWCLLKATSICGYFNMFGFRCICTVLTGTLPLEHWQAPFYPLANVGSPLCPVWNPVTQSFWSISRRTLTWGYFTAEKKEEGSKFHSAVGSLAARQHFGNQKEVVEVCSTSWWKSNGDRALAKYWEQDRNLSLLFK